MTPDVLKCLLSSVGIFAAIGALAEEPVRPNIVLIYADDIGYGDFGCYGATALQTPNVDRLAREGLRFTDGHSPAATCTPSRYALLTGQYAWRQKGTGILPGDAALIIEPGRTTLASMLQQAGYTTGAIGKWHLGLGRKGLDWNGPIEPGPLEIGFDYCYLIPATGDRVPCVYVENHRVVGLDPRDPLRVSYSEPVGDEPTGRQRPDLLKMRPKPGHDMTIVNGISRIGTMSGGRSAHWVDEDMADVITDKATQFIERHRQQPFFLYFATHDIHVPRVPHPRFVGKSGMGPRGDAIVQFDWCVGQILSTLDRLELTDNTLVLLTSDNGPVLIDGYRDGAVESLGEHKPSGPWRGGKYSAFEGGTRVAFVARWPGRIQPGVSEALVSQIDLLASLARLTGQELAEDDAPDSVDILSALLGDSSTGREHLVTQSQALSLRHGRWKYIEPNNGPQRDGNGMELGNAPSPQLYDLAADPGETRNLADSDPQRVHDMRSVLDKLRLDKLRKVGRSRAGP